MLRYFYLLICIQLCFSIEYIDNSDIDRLENRIVRSKGGRLRHRKYTRSPKRSRVVQFDVDNFMRPSDEGNEYSPYSYRNEKETKRRASDNNYGDENSYIISTENINTKSNIAEDSSIVDHTPEAIARAPLKDAHGRRFNFQTLSFEDKKDGKIAQSSENPITLRKLQEQDVDHSQAKCSFRNMKIPFFSYSKSSSSAKPSPTKKERRMFCFNCHKKCSRNESNGKDKSINIRIDEKKSSKIRKRDYIDLCPKCIREMLRGLQKKVNYEPTKIEPKITNVKEGEFELGKENKERKPISVDQPEILNTPLLGDYYYNFLPYIREKRSEVIEQDEQERDRRLKELEEVERKIENVHITAPTFSRLEVNVRN